MKLDAARVDAVIERSCGSCRYFCQSPHEIESQMPGMRSLGSGHAAVRASDGICRRHDRYLAAASRCADYERNSNSPAAVASTDFKFVDHTFRAGNFFSDDAPHVLYITGVKNDPP